MEKLTDQQNMIDEIAKLMCNFPQCLNYNKVGGCINDRCSTVDKAENVIKQGYIKQEWISVEERLPENDTEVLGYNGEIHCYIVMDGNFIKEKMWWLDNEGWNTAKGFGITHWQPLPQPPKMKGAE